jgi:hypothetical protein
MVELISRVTPGSDSLIWKRNSLNCSISAMSKGFMLLQLPKVEGDSLSDVGCLLICKCRWVGLVEFWPGCNWLRPIDRPMWKWTKNRQFGMQSMYRDLCRNCVDRSFRHIWKAKIPLKIKIQMWLIWHNSIPKITWWEETGWATLGVSSVMILNQFTIISLNVLLLSLSEVV